LLLLRFFNFLTFRFVLSFWIEDCDLSRIGLTASNQCGDFVNCSNFLIEGADTQRQLGIALPDADAEMVMEMEIVMFMLMVMVMVMLMFKLMLMLMRLCCLTIWLYGAGECVCRVYGARMWMDANVRFISLVF